VTYSRNDIAQWLKGAFAVNSMKGNELQFDCPVCDHSSCYFNVDKQIGFCHHAKCHTTFTVEDLIGHIGYPPELAGYTPALDHMLKDKHTTSVLLPSSAKQIEPEDAAVTALSYRGVTWDHIVQFRIHHDDKRFYVPVYEGGELRQYNSRRIDKRKPVGRWFDAGDKPYKYASGHPITNYFLGWEECKMWGSIVLVENTFVSMWLRSLNATATFGSHLSDTHIDKLVHSNIDLVTFLWDGGTGRASEKAARRLKMKGIPSKVVALPGKKQPDDYTKGEVKEMLRVA
jgi:hypothetical protein